jgi:uroporphyrinogen decarboxylase
MRPRDRIHAILNGGTADRIPVDLWYTPEIEKQLKAYYKADNNLDLFEVMGLDKIVWIFPEYKTPFKLESQCGQSEESGMANRTLWGVPLKKVQSGEAVYYECGEPPLKQYETPKQLEDYEFWPKADNVDYTHSKQIASTFSKNYATIGPWVSFFEIYCQMRGLEQSLIDLMTNEELVDAILDKIEESQTAILKRYIEILADDLDMVFISDDMGMQQNLLVSLTTWDKFFRSRLKRWCDLVHSFNKKVFYHSDGAIEPLIPALLDCGIDILNPIQHVCPGMNMSLLKKNYGNHVVFHGGVDNQSVLPFGNTEDVKRETLNCLTTLGAGGRGYIVCSCHNVQPGTPVENIITMIDTVRNFKI